MRYGRENVRTARLAVAVVIAAVVMGGCSSGNPEQDKNRQQDYCTELGAWQDAEHPSESLGRTVIAAARRLDRAGLEIGGTRILDDTVDAIRGDAGAEDRAVSYCGSAGFETLVG
ncbi:hypothetical protein OG885_14045 [Streptomyces sp. NBC_00028]|uniref:hypothetical protein n=1 Tax=Streptomyces sp. NBC_00028 TaxID=2975624 RepID=UPI003253294C